jgi:hypothetical protein
VFRPACFYDYTVCFRGLKMQRSDGSRVLIECGVEPIKASVSHFGVAADADTEMLCHIEEAAGHDAGVVFLAQQVQEVFNASPL